MDQARMDSSNLNAMRLAAMLKQLPRGTQQEAAVADAASKSYGQEPPPPQQARMAPPGMMKLGAGDLAGLGRALQGGGDAQQAATGGGSRMPQPIGGPSDQQQEHPVVSAARKSGADVDTMLKAGDVDGIAAAAQKADPGFSSDQGVMFLDDFARSMGKELGGGQDQRHDDMLRGLKMQDRGLNRGWGNNAPQDADPREMGRMLQRR